MPARSTTETGRPSVGATNSSRSRATARSPNRWPAYWAYRVSRPCASTQPAIAQRQPVDGGGAGARRRPRRRCGRAATARRARRPRRRRAAPARQRPRGGRGAIRSRTARRTAAAVGDGQAGSSAARPRRRRIVPVDVVAVAGDQRPVAGSRSSRSAWVPVATIRPSRRCATVSARPSSSGDVVSTTVVRPARAARSRSAMRASVCASTAEVGSRGSAPRARRAGPGPGGPAGAGRRRACGPGCRSGVSSPSRQRVDDVLGRRGAQRRPDLASSPHAGPGCRRISRSVPANRYESWSATRMRARTSSSAIAGQRHAAPGHVADARSGRAGRPARSPRPGRRRRRRAAGPRGTVSPVAGIVEVGAGRVGRGHARARCRPRRRPGSRLSRAMIRRAATRPRMSS